MGSSDKHASTVPLVLNPETGVISPQFHVVVDEWFATIATSTGEMPDFNKDEWTMMFGENQNHYLGDEDLDDDDNDVPPPQMASIDRRERRISNAMDHLLPPVALPVPDPPTTPTSPRTPTRNRFEPLSTFDDEDIEPRVVINAQAEPDTPYDTFVPMDSPIQREPMEQVVSEQVIPEESAPVVEAPVPQASPTPQLRRSTRERRAPDRLNLWTESPSCFLIR